MNRLKFIILLLIPVLSTVFTGCDQEPIFTEMSTNKLKIVIKGTLESETPANWIKGFTPGDDPGASPYYVDGSVDEVSDTSDDLYPTKFMFDIAELKLNGKSIGNYRQIIEADLVDTNLFFNGTGIELENDDPGNGNYDTVQLYVRKMIFDNAQIYQNTGSFIYEEAAEVIFNENDVTGFNFNNLQVNSYWDSLRDNADEIIRIFPIEIPIIGGMKYDRENGETVLEIRIVIKNFIKMYEYDYYDEGVYKVCHFWAFSDWLRDVRADEQDMGRNIHAVARAYVPGKTGTITGSATSGHYVMVIPENVASHYFRSGSGDALRNAAANCDFPVAPVYSGAHIESVLDYYCNYEAYKVQWNAKLGTCADFTTYSTAWNAYEDSVDGFKIAPYVTIATGSGYTFNNVAPGTYYVYTHAAPSDYGDLFEGDWISVGTVTVTEGSTVSP